MSTKFVNRTETFIPGSTTLAQKYFTSQEIFQRELVRIFYQNWICIGRCEAVSHPGDYFLLNFQEESLIVVRGRDHQVRAFYNVCRHRGTRICTESSGRFSETIQCPYHAWTYALDGSLMSAPFMQEVEDFDKTEYPLHTVAVKEWEGFLLINIADSPQSFESSFAPVFDRFARFGLKDLKTARRNKYHVRSNWKLIVQNYSECLHCPTLHPRLAHISPFQSGKNDLVQGRFLGGYMEIANNTGSLTMSGRTCGVPIGELPAEDASRVYYYTLFPNMFLSLHPDYAMVHLLWPEAPGLTRVTCDWIFHPASFAQPDFDPGDAIEFWDMTNRQDWTICEQSQLGIASRSYRPGPYSARESLPAAWDDEYLRQLEG